MSYRLNPKSNICPRIYGPPKIHNERIPLRPIVDFTGSPTYEWARQLATILKPLMGQTTTHVHNAATFCDEIKRFTIDDVEVIVSYDVVSLYIKVPIHQALDVIQQRLDNDTELSKLTQLSPSDLIELCLLCLRSTVFMIREKLYAQTEGQHIYGKL